MRVSQSTSDASVCKFFDIGIKLALVDHSINKIIGR